MKKVAVPELSADCDARPYSARSHTLVPGVVIVLVVTEVINNLPTVAAVAVAAVVATADQRITDTYEPFAPAV